MFASAARVFRSDCRLHIKSMDEISSILLIIAFVVYPIAVAYATRWIMRNVQDHRSCRALSTACAAIGLVPAGWLLVTPMKVESVGYVAAIVVMLWFASTGAFIGAAFDWLRAKRAPR